MTTISLGTPRPPIKEKKAPSEELRAALAHLEAEVIAPEEFPLDLTSTAIAKALEALEDLKGEDGDLFRIGVKGGGCAGFEYGLTFSEEADDDDLITIIGGLKVIIDTFSAGYLKGSELDYEEGLEGSGFKFNNPNARRTCGCGSSFTT